MQSIAYFSWLVERPSEFNGSFISNGSFLGFDVTIPIEYDEYDDGEEQKIRIAIERHIGWNVRRDIWNNTNYIERQHMCVKVSYMLFLSPIDLLGIRLQSVSFSHLLRNQTYFLGWQNRREKNAAIIVL